MNRSSLTSPLPSDLTNRGQAFRIVIGQLVVTLLAAFFLIPAGMVHAWSGLIGGAIATLASVFFALTIFVRYQADKPGKLIGRFYSAELIKLLLTGILFAAAFFLIKPLSVSALFGIFLLVQMAPIVIVLIFCQ